MAESHRGKALFLALTVFVVMPVRAALLEASLSDLMRTLPHALWGLDSRLLAG